MEIKYSDENFKYFTIAPDANIFVDYNGSSTGISREISTHITYSCKTSSFAIFCIFFLYIDLKI